MKRRILDHLGLYTWGDWIALALLFALAGVVAIVGDAYLNGSTGY